MVLGLLYRRHQADVEHRLFSFPIISAGVIIYVLGLYSYASTLSYVLNDALIGTGLFIILAHMARWCDLLPRVGSTLARVGAFSYGLYLLHQPYVIYFGERVRDLNMLVVSVLGCLLVAVLAACTIPLERYVNLLTSRVLDRRRDSRQMSVPSYQQSRG
jgi:peptidoglycan/LPS O-acetylase OafA/YrhL